MQRNYNELSPFDFECLVRDLLQKILDQRLEVFPPGKDGGVDIRLLRNPEEPVFVQCKHSPNGTYSKIKGQLRREAAKASALNGEYWLATSASLTARNKDQIVEQFGSSLLSADRILSRLDIDNLLNEYPEVERQHYKLYISSSGVLEHLLSPELGFRDSSFLSDLSVKSKLFVQTDAFNEARDLLAGSGVCIISGQPGVGKTTLAQMLILDLVSEGYEFHLVAQDISDAERVFKKDRKQVFFYDDFLGQTSLEEKFGNNQDARLLSLIRTVHGSDRHALILTTREYILREAQRTYEKLKPSNVDLYKYILDMASCPLWYRAQILYNHLYYSELSKGALKSVVEHRRYWEIIEHRNYNPRLIEFAVHLALCDEDLEPLGSFAQYLIESLESPSELWRHAFENQLSSPARDLLSTLLVCPSLVGVSALQRAVRNYQTMRDGMADRQDVIRKAIRDTNGVFVRTKRHRSSGEVFVELANASLVDFLKKEIAGNREFFMDVLEGAIWFEQLHQLYDWSWGAEDDNSEWISDLEEWSAEELQGQLRRNARRFIDKMLLLLDSKSDGLYASMALDNRILSLLRFYLRTNQMPTDLHLEGICFRLINHWITVEDANRYLAVEIATVISRLGYNQSVACVAELFENIEIWLELELESPEDYSNLLRFYEATQGSNSDSLAHLRKRFKKYGERLIRQYLSSGDATAIRRIAEELSAVANDFGLVLPGVLGLIKRSDMLGYGSARRKIDMRKLFSGSVSVIAEAKLINSLFDTLPC